jgi:hypothetical protein
MLRRRLLTFLLCLIPAVYGFGGEAMFAMHADQVSVQQDAGAGNCPDDGKASNACELHCAVGACIACGAAFEQFAPPTLAPVALAAVPAADCRCAPDTAPPKATPV